MAMLLSFVCLLLLQLIPIFALPTRQLKVSLIVEKDFHPFNSETVLLQGDSLIVSSDSSAKFSNHDWFMAQFTPKGSFDLDVLEKQLVVSKDGSLKLAKTHIHKDNESNSQHDDEVQRHIFSIKEGRLTFNGVDDFTLCPLDQDKDQYSVHLTYSESASVNCVGGINGIQFKVYNQLGIQAHDFEAPEFLYNTGTIVYF